MVSGVHQRKGGVTAMPVCGTLVLNSCTTNISPNIWFLIWHCSVFAHFQKLWINLTNRLTNFTSSKKISLTVLQFGGGGGVCLWHLHSLWFHVYWVAVHNMCILLTVLPSGGFGSVCYDCCRQVQIVHSQCSCIWYSRPRTWRPRTSSWWQQSYRGSNTGPLRQCCLRETKREGGREREKRECLSISA